MLEDLPGPVKEFLGGPLNLVSSAVLIIAIATLAVMIYISVLLKHGLDQQRLTYGRILFIEEYVRRQSSVRQSHISFDDIDMPRPPITRPTIVQRPRDESIAPRGGRMGKAVKREVNSDGIRHDRELHDEP